MLLKEIYEKGRSRNVDCLVNDLQDIQTSSFKYRAHDFLWRNMIYILFVVVVLVPFSAILFVQLVESDGLRGNIVLVSVFLLCVAACIKICHDHVALITGRSRLESDRK
jgi:hypothetical protein